MRKFFRYVGIFFGILIVAIVGLLIYFNSNYPDVDPPRNIKVESTPERIARGEYLAKNVTICLDCHSTRDYSKFSAPIVPGSDGKGGEGFLEEYGFPGNIYSKNLTPAAIGNWTDGELIRAITCGVNKDDKALFPLMPYLNYNQLSEEDLYSIVAYLRTLKPIENQVPETELNFPLNLIVKTIPVKSYEPKKSIDTTDVLNYGKYLFTIASCADCHTQSEKGEPLPGMYCAGGMEFPLPGGTLRSSNITPDIETGIGSWSLERFLDRFRIYRNPESIIDVTPTDYNTIMPMTFYAGMTDKDLSAIYTYMQTLKPVKNKVERFSAKK
ncbi:MAG: cytochrome c [Ignavibacteriales bacterium]|nr:cytochrome c [Ignavibacteriales bacterium]